ncbi:hypothetical protein MSLAZ_1522 [Methanosarcina lacustris Z-7289]|uniref:Uncharacterized protein n=1 Tax=Methanosarcina lacustris Z-7289 TaxID=1434111 RepID=A0A0E3S717_9EURY|nr:hypothetical protein [Methanosarcina lacustris]AKB74783.1 hypothetical protein MSLAZ_1522 [Methanosarcina lacustris Z-7289]
MLYLISPKVLIIAVQEFAKIWQADPDTLLLIKEIALKEKDEFVRDAAVRELIDGWQDEVVTEFKTKLV